jgi:tRNA(Ile)-lysidine synthase
MSTSLIDHLARALDDVPGVPLVVAFSGGPDSTALLHALASQMPRPSLRALHVDHGLHADSATWAVHCRRLCDSLGLPIEVVRVTVDLTRGEGIEAAARRARHEAFASALKPGEYVVLAHHRDDQMETVLLKLMRGAGPDGLAGMKAMRPSGVGMLWRPLLDLPRSALLDHIAANGLATLHDPSNDDPRIARGYLRATVIPALVDQWPQAAISITHSARLCREAADGLREGWIEAFDRLRRDENTLDAREWLDLRPAWRAPLLDHWLHAAGLSAPTTAQREALERQIREASAERLPLVGWQDTEVRVWKGRLWAMPRCQPFDEAWSAAWQGEPLTLPGGGVLTLGGARLPAALMVRYRRGGDRIRTAGNHITKELRDLFQEGSIPPWRRPRMPLLCENDSLIAVGGRWLSDRGKAIFDEAGALPMWQHGVSD